MKNQKLPSREELQKLLAEAERLKCAGDQIAITMATLRDSQATLRTEMCEALNIAHDPNLTFKQLGDKAAKAHVLSRGLAVLLVANENTVNTLNADRAEHAAQLKALRAKLDEARTVVVAAKRVEYDALLAEIEKKLLPYCDGNDAQAHWLAQLTPLAISTYQRMGRCLVADYTDDNPTQAVRLLIELATS